MLRVGLTGSIAVGKSFVCGVLREEGCHVMDADVTAREVVRTGTEGLEKIIKAFGSEVLLPTGELDRSALGAIVFADQDQRLLLNSIVHPLVKEAQDRWLRQIEEEDPKGVGIVDAALMIESGGYKRFEKLIVVWCEPAEQVKRLMLRDRLERDEAERRIAAQMPQEEKKSYADYLIDTTGGFDAARSQAQSIAEQLRRLAS